jgi:hypothetical protein
MSRTNRNFVIAYVLLVGLPLLGLLGILKVGRTLTAPRSLAGLWRIEKINRASSLPCANAAVAAKDAWVRVSQSGKQLVFTLEALPRMSALGVLEGQTVRASLQPSVLDVSATCAEGRSLTLTATVGSDRESDILAGAVSVDGCASCEAMEFRAIRQSTSPREAR